MAVDIEEEVALPDLAAYSWMGFVEAIIATWATRTGSGYLVIAFCVIVGYSVFVEASF